MKILIVEDHPLFREGLQFVLSEIDEALSFSESPSLNAINAEELQQADLILLDLGLSDSKGIESLIRLKALNPPGSIVIISGENEPYLIQECIEQGAAGFIPKTTKPVELIAALRQVVAGGIFLPQHSMVGVDSTETNRITSEYEAVRKLTDRQRTALLLAGRGFPNKTIASRMKIAEGTVKLHLHAAYKTLGVKNRTEAVFLISRTGLSTQK